MLCVSAQQIALSDGLRALLVQRDAVLAFLAHAPRLDLQVRHPALQRELARLLGLDQLPLAALGLGQAAPQPRLERAVLLLRLPERERARGLALAPLLLEHVHAPREPLARDVGQLVLGAGPPLLERGLG